MTFKLTNKKPTKEGWYWCQFPAGNYFGVVSVMEAEKGMFIRMGMLHMWLEGMNALWSQRIPEPTMPKRGRSK